MIYLKAGIKVVKQKIISYAWVSAITSGAQWKPHCLSGKAKWGSPKVYQSGLRLLWGTSEFKGQIPSPVASDIRIKLQQLQQQVPAASLDEMIQKDTNTFYNREQEREAKAQEREKRKRQGMPRCCSPFREALRRVLEGQVRGKCLICRQAGRWAKEYPNHGKSPKMACCTCHQLGHWSIVCPWDTTASRSSAKTSLTMVQ